MIYRDYSYLNVIWNEEISCVVMEWKKFSFGDDFMRGLNSGLDLLTEKNGTKWLADMRKMGVVGELDQKWAYEEWFPKAVKNGLKFLALVVPEKGTAQMSVELIMNTIEKEKLVYSYFNQINEAIDWIKEK